MADDVWSYATGERGAEQARHGLEQARAEFDSSCAFVVRMNGIEAHRERTSAQHRKRWSWNDHAASNGRMTVRRCNKPDVMGLSAEIFALKLDCCYSVLTGGLLYTLYFIWLHVS